MTRAVSLAHVPRTLAPALHATHRNVTNRNETVLAALQNQHYSHLRMNWALRALYLPHEKRGFMKDGYGRQINYLRISLTDKCNLRCIYCMPEEGVCLMPHDALLSIEEITRCVKVATRIGIKNVRLTGGEPLVRKGILALVQQLSDIPEIENISLTTNGTLLKSMALPLKEAGLNRVNISLDTLSRETYAQVTRRDKLHEALEGIQEALRVDLSPVKINTVTVRSLKENYLEFAKMTLDLPIHVRFIEYMPIGTHVNDPNTGWGKQDVYPADQLIEDINHAALREGLAPLLPVSDLRKPQGSGPARYLAFPGARGTVGVISPLSRHFCSECNRLRLTADGKLRPCLFSDKEWDVRTALREGSDDDVYKVFLQVLNKKPDEHHDKVGTEREMSQIGG